MEREITEKGPLLDAGGRLRERGWSRRPVLAYDRAAIAAPAWRIKEWDYCVLGPERGLALTVVDNGYMGFLSASVLDLAEGGHVSDSVMTAFPMGAMRLPGSSEEGKVEVSAGPAILRFEAEGGERRLFKSIESYSHKERIRILQEAETCIQAAADRNQYRACEKHEQDSRERVKEQVKARHEALRAKVEGLRQGMLSRN